jgi:outer membrane protein OmpA-like peptidoglycan-associated protein
MQRRRLFMALAALAGAGLLLLSWALWWPLGDCDRPSCARHRFTVGIEIDALGEVEPIAFDIDNGHESLSLQSILRQGGIEVLPVTDELGLAYDPSSGPLDPADLFQFVSAWRNRGRIEGTDATLYALFVDALIADNGDNLFGVMFDTAGREGFAIAPRTTERFFATEESAFISTLQLRTFTHELLHALNRHHMDAAQWRDGRLTLEAPTLCIAQPRGRNWHLIEPPLMSLSPDTIRFFQTAAARDILPGRDNSPFTNRRASPTECEDARAQVAVPRTRWSVAMSRLRTLLAIPTAQAADEQQDEKQPAETQSEEDQQDEQPQSESVASALVVLQAQEAAYPLGYPIALRVIVKNTGAQPLPVIERLSPRFGMLSIEYRELDSETWRPLLPVTFLEPASDEHALLQPGEQTEETVPIYFSEDGWTFDKPGDYVIRAHLHVDSSSEDAISEPVTISVAAPQTADDTAVLQPLLDDQGELDRRIGRLLYFGGRIGDPQDISPIELAVEQYGHTAVGGALRLTLLSHRLRKPIDPQTGRRPLPDFDEARELFEDTCTDSGIAAMTSAVLRQRPDARTSGVPEGSASGMAAWDGTTPDGTVTSTYSDDTLQRAGPSLHFCFNEDRLRSPVRQAVSRLARQLRRERPERIVLVGHSDAIGSCRYNDALALKRAGAVKAALVRAGIRPSTIEIVSLGERRPQDFAWTMSAQDRNRRVEVLVSGREPEERNKQPVDAVLPRCPPPSTAEPPMPTE